MDRPAQLSPPLRATSAAEACVHRHLAIRIALVALVVAAGVAAVVFYGERRHLRELAGDRAEIRTGILRERLQPELNSAGGLQPEQARAALEEVSYKGNDLEAGHFVFTRLLDTRGVEIASWGQDSFQDPPEIERAMRDLLQPAGTDRLPDLRVTSVSSGRRQWFVAAVPMRDAQGTVKAWFEGVFAVSPREGRALAFSLLGAEGSAIAIVFVTALLLYPVILGLMGRLSALAARLLDANLDSLQSLGGAIAKRDSDTDTHNYRVTIYAARLAEAMRLADDDIRRLLKGAFLHDVGKIGVPDAVLLKPGRLTPPEFDQIKLHVVYGLDIVGRSHWLEDARGVVGGHHEKIDGTGYPNGLKGEEIPLLARLFAVADVFDALTSRRPYKEPMEYDQAIAIMTADRGRHFDAAVLDRFVEIARPLFDTYARGGGDEARAALDQLITRYFRSSLGDLVA